MTTNGQLDAFESEYLSDGGFFLKLRSCEFDPVGAARVASLVRLLSLSLDHGTNYRLLWLLWGAQFDLDAAAAHVTASGELRQMRDDMLGEFIRVFGSELHALIENHKA